jgi:hypothetical protein
MKAWNLLIIFGLLCLSPCLIEARFPSPWMSYAQEKNKAKKEKQQTVNKLNQNIKKTEADQRKNRSRTTPKTHKIMPTPTGGG